MAGLYYAQVILASDSSLPEDVAVNGWHFQIDGSNALPLSSLTDEEVILGIRPAGPDENGVHGDLSDFYADVAARMSSAIDPTQSRIKWYNTADPTPRQPVVDEVMKAWTPSAAVPFPSEVALVCSFQADPVSGVSQARRRNRIFLGPLSSGVAGQGGRPSPTTLTDISDAMENLADNSRDQPYWTWVVNSDAAGVTAPVKNGWVDDAYDTQRRRGIAPSMRETWASSAI